MAFGFFSRWNTTVKQLLNGERSAQSFVNANAKKTLYYSTPFLTSANGGVPNAVQKADDDTAYFPVFTSLGGLKTYMNAAGYAEHIVIKGDLKSALSSLDAHPALSDWGVVIDLQSALPVELPPHIRVQGD